MSSSEYSLSLSHTPDSSDKYNPLEVTPGLGLGQICLYVLPMWAEADPLSKLSIEAIILSLLNRFCFKDLEEAVAKLWCPP